MVKTILITDATDGIGKHLAKKLVSEGHQVILHGRNHQKLELALQEVRAVSLRGRVFSYLADFSKLEDVYRFVEEIKRDFQRVDVLFNNAGLYAGKERKASAENVELTFMLSVLVPYMLTTELSPLLEKRLTAVSLIPLPICIILPRLRIWTLDLRKNTIQDWPIIIPNSIPFG